MTEQDSTFSGFNHRDQELKYNLTVFDLIMTLSARVGAALQSSKPVCFLIILTRVKKRVQQE